MSECELVFNSISLFEYLFRTDQSRKLLQKNLRVFVGSGNSQELLLPLVSIHILHDDVRVKG